MRSHPREHTPYTCPAPSFLLACARPFPPPQLCLPLPSPSLVPCPSPSLVPRPFPPPQKQLPIHYAASHGLIAVMQALIACDDSRCIKDTLKNWQNEVTANVHINTCTYLHVTACTCWQYDSVSSIRGMRILRLQQSSNCRLNLLSVFLTML